MKILLASDCYTFQTGGVTTVVVALEKGLRAQGHEVKVLALSNTRRSYKEGDSYYIGSLPFPDYPEHRFSFRLHDPLIDELIGWDPDIIHIHTEFTVCRMAKYIAKKTDTPIVMTTHTDFEYFNFGRFRNTAFVSFLGRTWGKSVYKQAVKVVVPSEKARGFAHLQPHKDKVIVIPNGIETMHYQKKITMEEKEALLKKNGLIPNGKVLVMVTRLSKEKNVIEILRFFPALLKKIPDVQLLLVGDGPDRKKFEKFCEDNGFKDHVSFTGRVCPEDVYKYYNLGDVFVSASLFELHSMSYLEAMAAGLPLVCREDLSLRGVLEDGVNGYIYEDENGFTEGVSKLLQDPDNWEKMHCGALVQAERSDVSHFIENTAAFYASVLRGSGGRAN